MRTFLPAVAYRLRAIGRRPSAALAVFLCLSFAFTAFAQSRPAAAAHWDGVLQVPNHELKIAVDLDVNEKGEWIGDLDVPEQGMTHFPLSKIAVKGNMVRFELAGIPGDPSFEGEISPDGKILAGDFSQNEGSVPGELKWVSEPKVVLPPKNTPITKEFEGSWEGSIPAPDGNSHPAVLKLANGPDGAATGTLLGRDGVQFPVNAIAQEGNQLKFELKAIGGVFTGELKNGELTGAWKFGAGKEFPLTFKHPAPK